MKIHGIFRIGGGLALVAWAAVASAADLEAGKKLYDQLRCARCHAINDQGGKTGPDLSHIGAVRDRKWLIQFLKQPKSVIADAKMMAVRASDAELAALADYLASLKP
ncbi:MAG TPA: cytochrome c [Nitrospiria bacterium]|nr:cytochrome c [Nitrospiria bacterium]